MAVSNTISRARQVLLWSAGCVFLPCLLWAAPADTLTLRDGTILTGCFDGLKNGRINLITEDGKVHKFMPSGVVSLTVNPPAQVQVKSMSAGKRSARFVRFEKGKYYFQTENTEEIEIPRVSVIEPEGLDSARFFGKPTAAGVAAPPAEAADIISLLNKQGATIVHFAPKGADFDPASTMASTRTGNYLSTLEQKHRGRVKVVVVEIDGWKNANVEKHTLKSLPQFWIYDRRGANTQKLVDRFMPEDIDAALKAALR